MRLRTRIRRAYWYTRGYPCCGICRKRVRHNDIMHMRMIHRDGSPMCQCEPIA